MKWYLLHPAAVHFPVALLTLGLAVEGFFCWKKRPQWLSQGASWLLWLGTAAAWAALGLGLLAEDAAPHVPAAWKTLAEHKELAFWTVGLFTFLSLWRWRAGGRFPKAFLAAWLVSAVVLLSTAYHGGELVFTYGMGVASAP